MKAWTVKRLAEKWECSPRHIYHMIDDGRLKAFSLGPRTLRISDDEVRRCESERTTSIVEETSASDGAAEQRLRTIEMRAVAAAVRA